MNIVINDEVVGELREDGEIITDDIWLEKLAKKIKRQKLSDLTSRRANGGLYFYLKEIKKGNPSYSSVVANILLDNGYGLK